MKLAEALILRSDCKKRLAQLRERMANNARMQESEMPSEDPVELIAEYDRLAADLGDLMRRINRTNTATQVDAQRSLTDALAERDVLLMRHKAYRELAKEATVILDRYSRSEIPIRSALNVTSLQADADRIAKQYRELDSVIQRINWEAELQA